MLITCSQHSLYAIFITSKFFKTSDVFAQMNQFIDVSKIDENRCKQTLASLP